VIALKAPVGAKQRLAGVLTQSQRRLVALALGARCLRCAMRTWPTGRVVVVGAGEEVAELAARHGVGAVLSDPGSGQSAAVAIGARWVVGQGLDRLVTVAGDLPDVREDDLRWLRRLAEDLGGPGVVAVPDTAGTGTNALVVRPATADVLAFGPDSIARHRARAMALGLPFSVAGRPTLARDCDRPEDLRAILAGGDGALRGLIDGGGPPTLSRVATPPPPGRDHP